MGTRSQNIAPRGTKAKHKSPLHGSAAICCQGLGGQNLVDEYETAMVSPNGIQGICVMMFAEGRPGMDTGKKGMNVWAKNLIGS
jgi:hypothetical protein